MSKPRVLTDPFIRSLKPAPAGKRYAVADALVPGLKVRVTDRGTKSFILWRRYSGAANPAARSLGEVGTLTLAEAREKARRWLELIKAGKDPAVVARRERDARARANAASFAAVAEAYIASGLHGKRKASVVAYQLRREVIPIWRDHAISEISRHDVIDLIQKIADRPAPAFARNILDAVRGVFNWAVNRPAYGLEFSPTDRVKPKAIIGAKAVRERVLDDDELKAVWRVAERTPYPYGPLVRFLLLTGCRVSEVGLARWSEFDLERGEWVIPAARFKMNAEHRVPLTADMIDFLEALPRWKAGNFLFSMNGSKPFNGYSTSKRRFDRRALRSWRAIGRARGIDRRSETMASWILHDLRRTVRTRLAALRVRDTIAELVIGHAKKGLARVYDQHEYREEIREALTAWNNLLKSIVAPPPDNVVKLKTARKSRSG